MAFEERRSQLVTVWRETEASGYKLFGRDIFAIISSYLDDVGDFERPELEKLGATCITSFLRDHLGRRAYRGLIHALKMKSAVIAGGFILSCLYSTLQLTFPFSDIDIFIEYYYSTDGTGLPVHQEWCDVSEWAALHGTIEESVTHCYGPLGRMLRRVRNATVHGLKFQLIYVNWPDTEDQGLSDEEFVLRRPNVVPDFLRQSNDFPILANMFRMTDGEAQLTIGHVRDVLLRETRFTFPNNFLQNTLQRYHKYRARGIAFDMRTAKQQLLGILGQQVSLPYATPQAATMEYLVWEANDGKQSTCYSFPCTYPCLLSEERKEGRRVDCSQSRDFPQHRGCPLQFLGIQHKHILYRNTSEEMYYSLEMSLKEQTHSKHAFAIGNTATPHPHNPEKYLLPRMYDGEEALILPE